MRQAGGEGGRAAAVGKGAEDRGDRAARRTSWLRSTSRLLGRATRLLCARERGSVRSRVRLGRTERDAPHHLACAERCVAAVCAVCVEQVRWRG